LLKRSETPPEPLRCVVLSMIFIAIAKNNNHSAVDGATLLA